MKICLDVRYQTESGASSYIKNLVPLLLELDRTNEYVLVKYPGQRLGGRADACPALLAPGGNPVVQMLWTILVLPLKLHSAHIDIYHCLKGGGPIWGATYRIRTFHSINLAYRGEFPTSWKRSLLHTPYINWFTKRCDRVIAVSDFVKEFLTERLGLPAERIDVIYHGVDSSFRRIEELERIALTISKYSLPKKYILCVGNVFPVKNHITAVEAFAKLADKTELDLVIAGSTAHPYCDRVRAVSRRLGVEHRVHFPGFVSGQDLAALMSGAAGLLLPSLTEGCPLTLLEAMKCGAPIVASKRGGLWDVGQGYALFVDDPADGAGFARQIWRLLTSEDLRRELRDKGMRRAEEFAWERAALATIETYRATAGQSLAGDTP